MFQIVSRVFASAALAAFVVLSPVSGQATVALHLSNAQQAQKSDLVVIVKVVRQRTFALSGSAHTDTTVRVLEVVKGAAEKGQLIDIRQLGGTLGDTTTVVPGDAHFEVGEQCVLFLADREPDSGVLFLTAMAQSKFDIVGSAADGDRILVRDLAGTLLLDGSKNPVLISPEIQSLRQLELDVKSAKQRIEQK